MERKSRMLAKELLKRTPLIALGVAGAIEMAKFIEGRGFSAEAAKPPIKPGIQELDATFPDRLAGKYPEIGCWLVCGDKEEICRPRCQPERTPTPTPEENDCSCGGGRCERNTKCIDGSCVFEEGALGCLEPTPTPTATPEWPTPTPPPDNDCSCGGGRCERDTRCIDGSCVFEEGALGCLEPTPTPTATPEGPTPTPYVDDDCHCGSETGRCERNTKCIDGLCVAKKGAPGCLEPIPTPTI